MPGEPTRVGPESPLCPNSPSGSRSGGDTTQAFRRHSVDNRPSAGDHRTPILSVAAVEENPFAAEEDPLERGDGTASGENLDVKHTISQSGRSSRSKYHFRQG